MAKFAANEFQILITDFVQKEQQVPILLQPDTTAVLHYKVQL